MSCIEIKAACLRDASYVLGNLNADDSAEVLCQLPPGMKPQELAPFHLNTLKSCIAYVDGVPAMFFGIGAINAACASFWSVGTAKAWRAVPEVTKFWLSDMVPWAMEQGFRFAEARSLATNTKAHRWLLNTFKAEVVTEPLPFGTQDEPFLLFRFTVTGYRSIYSEPVKEDL